MRDKVQWAYDAVSAIESEYGISNPDKNKEDECEIRTDHILSQLTDDEYEEYLEMIITKECQENEEDEENEEDC